jgi:hypothetical protein
VPTVTFRVLYCFVVLRHDRRRVVHFNVTANPTPWPSTNGRSPEVSRAPAARARSDVVWASAPEHRTESTSRPVRIARFQHRSGNEALLLWDC